MIADHTVCVSQWWHDDNTTHNNVFL